MRYLLLLALFTSCATIPGKQSGSNSSKPTLILNRGWFPQYDEAVKQSLKSAPHLMKYKNDVLFWQDFFCGISMAESNHTPWTTYWEKSLGGSCMEVWKDEKRCDTFIKDWNAKQTKVSRYASKNAKGWDRATKTFYLSEGLLQLSYSDKNYRGCEFDYEADKYKLVGDHTKTIFDYKRNLQCGVKILNSLVGKKGTPFFNTGHYWAVLKPRNARYADFKAAHRKCALD